jgi:hypothetical protein
MIRLKYGQYAPAKEEAHIEYSMCASSFACCVPEVGVT